MEERERQDQDERTERVKLTPLGVQGLNKHMNTGKRADVQEIQLKSAKLDKTECFVISL